MGRRRNDGLVQRTHRSIITAGAHHRRDPATECQPQDVHRRNQDRAAGADQDCHSQAESAWLHQSYAARAVQDQATHLNQGRQATGPGQVPEGGYASSRFVLIPHVSTVSVAAIAAHFVAQSAGASSE